MFEMPAPVPVRQWSAVPLDRVLQEAAPLSDTFAALLARPCLDAELDEAPDSLRRLQEHLDQCCRRAFGDGEEAALYAVHRSLSLLYDQNVQSPAPGACYNQFSAYLIRLRNVMEGRWLAFEQQRLTMPQHLPATAAELNAHLQRRIFEHPAARHRLFDFLAEKATMPQLVRYFTQDCALNIRFYDMIVLSLLGIDEDIRREVAQNFWDEVGRGTIENSHTNLFRRLLHDLQVPVPDDDLVSQLPWQGLAGYNLFFLTCLHRQHYFKSLGVMAITELLDPYSYEKVLAGCERVGISTKASLSYYSEHVSIDVVHGSGWLDNVISPLIAKHPAAIADVVHGGEMRLNTALDYYDHLLATLQDA